MAYVNIQTNEYPLFEEDIRLKHSEMGEEFVLPSGYSEVEQEAVPEHDRNHYPVAEPLLKIDGKYVQTFRLERLDDDAIYQRDSRPTGDVTKQYYWDNINKVWIEVNPLPTE